MGGLKEFIEFFGNLFGFLSGLWGAYVFLRKWFTPSPDNADSHRRTTTSYLGGATRRFLSVPAFACAWPLILVSVVLSFLRSAFPDTFTPHTCSMLWFAALMLALLSLEKESALGHEAWRQWKIWMLAVSWMLIALLIVAEKRVFPALTTVMERVGLLRFHLTIDSMELLSLVLGVAYVMMGMWTLTQNRWMLTPNSLIRRRWLFPNEEYVVDASHPVDLTPAEPLQRILTAGGQYLTYVDGAGRTRRLLVLKA